VSDVELVVFVEASAITLGEAAWGSQLDPGTGLLNIVEVVFDIVIPWVELTHEGGIELSCLTRGSVGVVIVDLLLFFLAFFLCME
jgi:hypothetical protein